MTQDEVERFIALEERVKALESIVLAQRGLGPQESQEQLEREREQALRRITDARIAGSLREEQVGS